MCPTAIVIFVKSLMGKAACKNSIGYFIGLLFFLPKETLKLLSDSVELNF